jgi:hypothetical protein
MVSVNSNLHPLTGFLMWEQIEIPRSKIWRAWRMCKDFPISLLQLSLDVKVVMWSHTVLKMTPCFSSFCFVKGKVTYYHATFEHNMHHWLKFQVELYGPTQVIHARRTHHASHSECLDFFLQLASVATSGNGFQHFHTSVMHGMSTFTTLPPSTCKKDIVLPPSLITECLQWPTVHLWHAVLRSACVESNLHRPCSSLAV